MTSNGPGRPRHDDVLTPGEWRVAEWVRHGLTNRRISERMNVSVHAVKFHVSNALSKLGYSRREELRLWNGVARNTALDQTGADMEAAKSSDGCMTLGQVARTARDVEEASAWYQDVLGLPKLYSFPGLAFLTSAACD